MFVQNMGFTQTIISTLAVIVLMIVTLSLNESVFKETDLSKPLGSVCNYVAGSLSPVSGEQLMDSRELLYGTFSVRGANISALILSSIAFGIAYFAKSIDLIWNLNTKWVRTCCMASPVNTFPEFSFVFVLQVLLWP